MSDTVTRMAKLRLQRDGPEVMHSCTFSADEWQRLERFSAYADDLAETKLITPGAEAFQTSLNVGDDGITFTAVGMPDQDDFAALLHRMRPFVLQNEATSFHRVANILARRLNHPAFIAYLDRQKAIFNGERWQLFNSMSNGTMINTAEMLTFWLNAYEYHRDEDKRTEFEALHLGIPALIDHATAVFVGMILDQARAIMEIRHALRALRANATIVPLAGDRPIQPCA